MKLRHFLVAGAACASLSAFAWDQQGNQQSSEQMQQDRSAQMQDRAAQLSHTQDQTIRDAQDKLAAQGYDPGPADGKLGPKTEEQIRKFQQDHQLQASGELDDQTLAALSAPQNSSMGASSTGSSSGSSSDKSSGH